MSSEGDLCEALIFMHFIKPSIAPIQQASICLWRPRTNVITMNHDKLK